MADKKFIASSSLDDIEILTDTGWVEAAAIHKTVPYRKWLVKTNKRELECADDHIVFRPGYQEVFVKDLAIGDAILTEDGTELVVSIHESTTIENMYDVELPAGTNHRYYTNGILSHNTTTYTIFTLWYAMFFSEKRIMVCANKLATAIEVMDRIRLAYEYLPKWIKAAITVYNKQEITFSNNSSIRAFATSSAAARGFSANVICIDEIAFIPKNVINDFFASVMPIISSSKNSKAVVVSTPNGTDNLYYEIWQAANMRDQSRNKEGWVPFRIDWWEVPGRDDEWKEKQIATIGIERWRQEFNNEFLTSSFQKLVPDDILEYYRRCLGEWKAANINQGYDAEILSSDENKRYRFKMWHSFNPDRTYVATADAADGTGGDYSVLQIWDVTNLSDIRLCCEFASAHVSTIEFAYIINEICKLYCSPFLIMESNGIGQAILEQLKVTYEYQNLTRLGKDGGYGVRSHMQVKSKACLWTREMLTTEGFGFEIYSKRLVDEMGTFVKKDTAVHVVYAALGKNSHDDFMMSFVWMAWMLSEENVERYFTVAEQFKSPLGKILPKTLQPQFEYTREEVVAARSARPTLMFEEWKEALKGNVGATPGLKYVPKEEPKQEPLPLNQPQRVDPFQQRREEIEREEEGRRHFAFAGGMGGGDEFGFGDGDWN